MIHSSTQLKAKIKNLSKGDGAKAQTLIRNYFMERFLERISVSQYKDRLILKGGMLVAAVLGLECRATMDMDTSVKSVSLSMENAQRFIREISEIEIGDEVSFAIIKVSDIMEEHDYPGIRVMLESRFDKIKQPIKIDISADDVITPSAVEFSYKLMFEDRSISLRTYNIETLLAEKIETIMARDIANTRMRDFYDIHALYLRGQYDGKVLKAAFAETSRKRGTTDLIQNLPQIMERIESDPAMQTQWGNYADSSFYVGELSWEVVMASVKSMAEKLG